MIVCDFSRNLSISSNRIYGHKVVHSIPLSTFLRSLGSSMMYPFFIPDTHSLSSLFFSQTDYSFINLFKELAFGFIKQNLGGGFPFIDF